MARALPPIRKIAVAIAGKSANPQTVHEAVRLANQLEAELRAVHIRYPAAGKATFMMDALPVFTEDDVREHFRSRGYKELAASIPVKIFTGNNPAKLLALVKALSTAPVQQQLMDVVECPVLVVPTKRRSAR